jgi:hypothetical protein
VLYLFPRQFRDDFGNEIFNVFEQVVDEISSLDPLRQTERLIKEFSGLFFEALHQNLSVSGGSKNWQGAPSKNEVWVALIIFAVPIIYLLMNAVPGLNSQVVWSLVCALGLSVFAVGLLKGFPRWSFPYLGLVISLLSFVFVFQYLADLAAPILLTKLGPAPADGSIHMLFQAMWAGLIWLSLLVITMLILGLLVLLRRFQGMVEYLTSDWTLVSYILYYGATFIIFLIYHQAGRPFTLAIIVCLACGAWLYLHSSTRAHQVLALTGGLTLAMIAANASWYQTPHPEAWYLWLGSLSAKSLAHLRLNRPVFDWVWMLLVLLAPAAMRRYKGNERKTIKPL